MQQILMKSLRGKPRSIMFLGFNSLLSQQAAGNLTQERLKINNKIQNDSPTASIVNAISDISFASGFTTHQ